MEPLLSKQWSAQTLDAGLSLVDDHVKALEQGHASEDSMRAELDETWTVVDISNLILRTVSSSV